MISLKGTVRSVEAHVYAGRVDITVNVLPDPAADVYVTNDLLLSMTPANYRASGLRPLDQLSLQFHGPKETAPSPYRRREFTAPIASVDTRPFRVYRNAAGYTSVLGYRESAAEGYELIDEYDRAFIRLESGTTDVTLRYFAMDVALRGPFKDWKAGRYVSLRYDIILERED